MRHSRLATTMEVYMQSLEREVRTAINSIHDELVATGTEGPRSSAAGGDIWTGSRSSHQGIEEHYGRRREEDRSAVSGNDFAICGQGI
jgi:hypothetical protein